MSEALELYDFFDSARRFFEFDFEVVAQVVAAPGARTRASAAGAEKIAKDVGENFLEALAEVETAESARTLRPLEGGVTETVILRAPLGIGEDLIGLVEFLELLLGLFVAGVAIGMKLNGETTVGLFQFVFAGAAIDTEDFVIVAFMCWRHRAKILCEHPRRRHCRFHTSGAACAAPPVATDP